MFDFDENAPNGIRLQVEQAQDVQRFNMNSLPEWMDLKMERPASNTPNLNNILALFHYNQADCQIVPATYIMNYKRCKMDIDRNLYFMKITCASIQEARKRALVLAYLTYDMTRHIFVKLNTS